MHNIHHSLLKSEISFAVRKNKRQGQRKFLWGKKKDTKRERKEKEISWTNLISFILLSSSRSFFSLLRWSLIAFLLDESSIFFLFFLFLSHYFLHLLSLSLSRVGKRSSFFSAGGIFLSFSLMSSVFFLSDSCCKQWTAGRKEWQTTEVERERETTEAERERTEVAKERQ